MGRMGQRKRGGGGEGKSGVKWTVWIAPGKKHTGLNVLVRSIDSNGS